MVSRFDCATELKKLTSGSLNLGMTIVNKYISEETTKCRCFDAK